MLKAAKMNSKDPIFAAIENHRKLEKAMHTTWLAADLAKGEADQLDGR